MTHWSVRGVVLLVLVAACGRFGFGSQPAIDASATVDGDAPASDASDAAIDGPALPAGLIAWWQMDDAPGDGVLDDSTGGGHTARCVAGVSCPTAVAGKHGNAIRFDGTQFARVTYGPWLGTSGPFTYAAWIYVEQDFDQVAFARPVGPDVGDSWDAVTWSVASGNGTCLEDADAGGANQTVCGATTPLNQWIHVAGRWDGATATLFMNGVNVAAKATPAVMFDTHDLIIGSDENTGAPAYQFHGRVDDLQLYNRALTDAEIAALAI
jgi:concanavalin A-like lectin/glucanase superfamily protein